MKTPPTVRRATPDDAPALVSLRSLMIEYVIGRPPDDNGWRESCEQQLRERLTAGSPDCAAFVVDGPGGVPVSSGIGWVHWHPPGPRNVSGRLGYIASMSTMPEARGQDCARAILHALMAWFAEIGVTQVNLLASDQGEPLYRSVGFDDSVAKSMTWYAAR